MTVAPCVVVMADDLTGAMDVAGPLAARGLNTLVAATIFRFLPPTKNPPQPKPRRFIRRS